MNDQKHTPEPWRFELIVGEECDEPNGWRIFSDDFTDDDDPVKERIAESWGGLYNEANASRICLCINACSGLSDEVLMGGWTQETAAAYALGVEDKLKVADREINHLRAENIGLSRVLKAAVELVCADSWVTAPHWSPAETECGELERVLRECGYITTVELAAKPTAESSVVADIAIPISESKPSVDWSKAPDWARWFAIDGVGRGHWFETKPERPRRFESDIGRVSRFVGFDEPASTDWTASLQERPKGM